MIEKNKKAKAKASRSLKKMLAVIESYAPRGGNIPPSRAKQKWRLPRTRTSRLASSISPKDVMI